MHDYEDREKTKKSNTGFYFLNGTGGEWFLSKGCYILTGGEFLKCEISQKCHRSPCSETKKISEIHQNLNYHASVLQLTRWYESFVVLEKSWLSIKWGNRIPSVPLSRRPWSIYCIRNITFEKLLLLSLSIALLLCIFFLISFD